MKKTYLGIIAVTAVIGAAAFAISNRPPSLISGEVKEKAGISLYQPSNLPRGYTFVSDSVDQRDDVVLYQVAAPNDQKVNVAQQPPPKDFDFVDFHTKQLKDKRTATTPLGEMTVGILADNRVGSILKGDTWILLSAPKEVGPEVFEEVGRGLDKS